MWRISCEVQWEGLKRDAGNPHQNSQRAFLGIAVQLKHESGLKTSECVMDLTARKEEGLDGRRTEIEAGRREEDSDSLRWCQCIWKTREEDSCLFSPFTQRRLKCPQPIYRFVSVGCKISGKEADWLVLGVRNSVGTTP